jgi:hypothetical protein
MLRSIIPTRLVVGDKTLHSPRYWAEPCRIFPCHMNTGFFCAEYARHRPCFECLYRQTGPAFEYHEVLPDSYQIAKDNPGPLIHTVKVQSSHTPTGNQEAYHRPRLDLFSRFLLLFSSFGSCPRPSHQRHHIIPRPNPSGSHFLSLQIHLDFVIYPSRYKSIV